MPGKGSHVKMVEMAEVGAPVSLDGVASIWIVGHGASACVIFILHQKIPKMANKDMIFEYHSIGAFDRFREKC